MRDHTVHSIAIEFDRFDNEKTYAQIHPCVNNCAIDKKKKNTYEKNERTKEGGYRFIVIDRRSWFGDQA